MFKEIGRLCAFFALGNGFVISQRLSAIRRHKKSTILTFHRVSHLDGSGYRPLDPILFNRLLAFLIDNFEIITFDQIYRSFSKPKLILSFDDGYKDFFEVAFPLLKRHRLRVNLNIIPECVETQRPPLNVMAQDFVGKAPRELVLKLNVPGFSGLSKDPDGSRLSSFLKNRSHAEQERLGEVMLPQFFAWDGFSPTPMMSREEIRQVGKIHEIGVHSYSHASMAYESNEYLKNDLLSCHQYFEELFGQPMWIYAFPNGSYREEQIDIVLTSGVRHVLLVGEDFAEERSLHKRFTFNASGLNEARFKALGGFRRL